jgi:DNA-binding MarR family transcriptional regulator
MLGRPKSSPTPALEARTSQTIMVETLGSLTSVGEEMTVPQLRTLLSLSTRGAQDVKHLAEDLNIHEAAIGRLCTRLVARGLVVRIPTLSNHGDLVALSTAGHRLVDDVIYRQTLAFERVIERLPATDRDLVVGALDLLARSAGHETWSADVDHSPTRIWALPAMRALRHRRNDEAIRLA